jgi:2-amino-4-hydroxy-6-hydroxymethyldihydropteridine diphosphokinase
MKKVFLCLGSNIGERTENLKEAKKMIAELIGRILTESGLYETEPWGFESENDFLNMVLCVETGLSPSGLMGRILMIESKLGRIRCETRYSSRSMDIDILLYGEEVYADEAINIPHPRLHERRFVLVPLSDIAPGFIHPVIKKSIKTLLEICSDQSRVLPYSAKS